MILSVGHPPLVFVPQRESGFSAPALANASATRQSWIDRAALESRIARVERARRAGTAATRAARGRPTSSEIAGATPGIGDRRPAARGRRDIGRVGDGTARDAHSAPGVANTDHVADIAAAVDITDGDRAALRIRAG
jgi:hypothetical protein